MILLTPEVVYKQVSGLSVSFFSDSSVPGGSRMKEKISFLLVSAIVFLFLLMGCAEKKTESSSVMSPEDNPNLARFPIWEILRRERLPNYNTLSFRTGSGYEIKNAKSNKLIICLTGGPGWFFPRMYAPGEAMGGGYMVEYFLHLKDEYSFFIPEKFGWERDNQRVFFDAEERERYTVDNLITNYVEVISEYLSQNNYKTVIIAGASEGGFIAPELYFRLKDFNISGLVVIAAGGLSYYERTEIKYEKYLAGMPPYHDLSGYDEGEVAIIVDAVLNVILDPFRFEPYPDSSEPIGEPGHPFYPGTYRYWNSYVHRRPIEFYENINIPVLFLHGEWDANVPVESTRYVEENLQGKPYIYRYYPEMFHWPDNYGGFVAWRRDIAAWLEAERL